MPPGRARWCSPASLPAGRWCRSPIPGGLRTSYEPVSAVGAPAGSWWLRARRSAAGCRTRRLPGPGVPALGCDVGSGRQRRLRRPARAARHHADPPQAPRRLIPPAARLPRTYRRSHDASPPTPIVPVRSGCGDYRTIPPRQRGARLRAVRGGGRFRRTHLCLGSILGPGLVRATFIRIDCRGAGDRSPARRNLVLNNYFRHPVDSARRTSGIAAPDRRPLRTRHRRRPHEVRIRRRGNPVRRRWDAGVAAPRIGPNDPRPARRRRGRCRRRALPGARRCATPACTAGARVPMLIGGNGTRVLQLAGRIADIVGLAGLAHNRDATVGPRRRTSMRPGLETGSGWCVTPRVSVRPDRIQRA